MKKAPLAAVACMLGIGLLLCTAATAAGPPQGTGPEGPPPMHSGDGTGLVMRYLHANMAAQVLCEMTAQWIVMNSGGPSWSAWWPKAFKTAPSPASRPAYLRRNRTDPFGGMGPVNRQKTG